jgi:hypothetical protein
VKSYPTRILEKILSLVREKAIKIGIENALFGDCLKKTRQNKIAYVIIRT